MYLKHICNAVVVLILLSGCKTNEPKNAIMEGLGY